MKPFHLNVGKLFSQPFESGYSRFRQFLIANPGIPLSTIKANIRLIKKSATNDIDFNFEKNTYLWAFNDGYWRQCPQCAKQFYHTSIFSLAWLECCPIHHCALTTICTQCKKPWPSKDEMTDRKCTCCGRPELYELDTNLINTIKKTDFTPIKKIYEFIQFNDYTHGYYFQNDVKYNCRSYIYPKWWDEVNVESTLYPAAQISLNPKFTKEMLKKLHIVFKPLKKKKSQLYAHRENNLRKTIKRHDQMSIELNENSQHQFHSNVKACQLIVKWISQQTPKRHKIHISNYRHLTIHDFVQAPDFCPFCLAFSLWFFEMASNLYGKFYGDHINDYPFCDESHYDPFYKIGKPAIDSHKQYSYSMSSDFNSWFYQRGLEISFLEKMHYVFELIKVIQEFRKTNTKKINYWFRYHPEGETYKLLSTKVINNLFYCYYQHEHPLHHFRPAKLSKPYVQCRDYHIYLKENNLYYRSFYRDEILNAELSKKDFIALLENFKLFLPAQVVYYRNYDPI